MFTNFYSLSLFSSTGFSFALMKLWHAPRRQHLRGLVTSALVLSTLLLNACLAQTLGVHVDAKPNYALQQVGSHPELTLAAADIDISVTGNVLADFDNAAMRTQVAENIQKNLGSAPWASQHMQTRVELQSPSLPLLRTQMGPIKELTIHIASTLPDKTVVQSEPLRVLVDANAGDWFGEAVWPALLLGPIALGSLGSIAVLQQLSSIPLDLSNEPFETKATYIGLISLVGLSPLIVGGVFGGLAMIPTVVFASDAQSQNAADALAQALERHALDVSRVLELRNAATSMPQAITNPSVTVQRPTSLPHTVPLPLPQSTPSSALSALLWNIDVDTEPACVDENTLRDELVAWLPEEWSAQALSIEIIVGTAADAKRVSIDAEIRLPSGELIASKKVAIDPSACAEVERLLAQALRRQLATQSAVEQDAGLQ